MNINEGGRILRYYWQSFFLLSFLIILASCSESGSNVTIEPYELSEKEQLLVQKTGVEMISYFTMNGILAETEDIHYEVQTFKNGKNIEGAFSLRGELKRKLDNELISFGVYTYQSTEKKRVSTLLAGQPNGLSSASNEHTMSSYSFSPLVSEKVTLTKNKPVYLAAWVGTSKNTLESFGGNNGELPESIQNTELAFVYKITLVDK